MVVIHAALPVRLLPRFLTALWIACALTFGVLIAPSAQAQEVNPVQPAAAKHLEDAKACVALAAQVGDHLLDRAEKTEHGITFGEGPAVYGGDAGVALLFTGLYRATQDEKWLTATRSTLRSAVAALPRDNGLYTGRAGIGQACVEAFWATEEKEFLDLARTCVGNSDAYTCTDIIAGAAGTGIFLLNLHRATADEKDLAAARRVGDYLLSTAVREDGKAHWQVVPGRNPRIYLGFSHGAAGVGYVLLHLGVRTGDAKYRDVAVEAARYVLAHEEREGEIRALWWRTVPKSDDYRRIQWCHGAPGTGLCFHALRQHVPKQKAFSAALDRCLATTKARGRAARRGGCQCHGVAGNAELFLEVHAADPSAGWLAEARRSGSVLLEPTKKGFAVRTQLGGGRYDASYMLGLAGIGHFVLRLADPAGTPLPMMVRE